MKLRRVRLSNWCQFESLEQELGNGLLGIVGRNGRGKSNILKAIIFACTGWTAQPKDLYLRWGATQGFVSVDFQTDASGKLYRITRYLHKPDVILYENYSGVWLQISAKSSDAREKLEELIPITKEFAEWVLDVPQEQMVSLFNETASRRNEVLQRIFSFQCLKRCRLKLMELIHSAENRKSSLEGQRVLLIDQVAQKRTWVNSFAKVCDREVIEQEMGEVQSRIGSIDTLLGQMQGAEYLKSEFNRLNTRLSEIRRMRQELPPQNPSPDENPEILTSRKSVIIAESSVIAQLQKELKTIQKTPTIAIPDSKEMDAAFQELTSTQANLTFAEQELRKLEACAKTGKCPTCGSDIPVTPQMLEQARQKKEELLQLVASTQMRVTKLKTEADAACKAQLALQGHWETARNLTQELKWVVMKTPDLLDVLLDRVKQESASRNAELAHIDDSLEKIQLYSKEYSAWSHRQDTLAQQEIQILADISKVESSDLFRANIEGSAIQLTSERETLRKRYAELKEQFTYRVQYDSAVSQFEEVQRSLSNVESRLSAMNPELLERLTYLGNWLLPAEFPRRVCASMYHILTEQMNANLIEFDFPYTVELQENGEFVCKKSTGLVQSASRLSGGEKMILSVAFRLALHDLFSSRDSAGFLMLDEPTTFLDEENRQSLKDVLARLKKSPKFGGMQIFVVTHDESLSPLFDYLIEL